MTFRDLSLMLCLNLSASFALLADEPVRGSPWEGTGLDSSFVDKRVNTPSCYDHLRTFLSCVSSIQRLLEALDQDLRLIPSHALTREHGQSPVLKRVGGAAVVRERGRSFIDEGNALDVLRLRSRQILEWRGEYPGKSGDRINFSALMDWLREDVVASEREEDLAAAAINGYLVIEDAHARVAPAASIRGEVSDRQDRRRSSQGASSTYTGIGASVQSVGDAVILSGVLREGPAANAGLRVHDIVLAVDGELIAGLPPEAVVGRLRGPSGTEVTLVIKRQSELRSFIVTRSTVSVKNVYSATLVDRGWEFAYLRVDSFLSGDTCRDVRRAWRKLRKPALNGLILDLRNNAGGLIDQAVCVADFLLPSGQTVLEMREVEQQGTTRRIRTRHGQLIDVPMVTLVNATTGSASEVLAGALQDHGRSYVVGERTFGKGTVQTARPWNPSGSVVEFYTVARYHRPSGRSVQLIGIRPDVEAYEQPGPLPKGRVVLREGDLFPTALAPETEWRHPPRSKRAISQSECVADEGLEN